MKKMIFSEAMFAIFAVTLTIFAIYTHIRFKDVPGSDDVVGLYVTFQFLSVVGLAVSVGFTEVLKVLKKKGGRR